MANKNISEKDVVNQFQLLANNEQKADFISNLPKNIKLAKILKLLPTDSARIEFLRISSKKGLFLNKWTREYNKKKKNISAKLVSTVGDYKKTKNILNPLRKSGENLLRNEALKTASEKNEKAGSFFKRIETAENIAGIVKENNYSSEAINNLFLKNIDTIKLDNIILENLKDIFDNDESLNKYQDEFNDFLVNHVENSKPINQIITEAEERILSGDISNVYQEIEKTEKLISQNIGQALIEVYNSIQVMDAKRNFIQYINDFERENISYNDINLLANKAQEYRNVELPNKWNEMNHKLQFTSAVPHYKAWFLGLQQGRYKNVVSDVKEYITKSLIKKLFKIILNQHKNITLENVNLYSLLDNKKSPIKEIKKAYKNFFDLKEVKKIMADPLLALLDSYMLYYFYLNYDISLETDILGKILDKLKIFIPYEDKIKYISEEKKAIRASIQDKNLQEEINKIFNKLLNLFNILNEKDKEKHKVGELQKEKLDKPNETIDFLNSLNNEHERTGKIKDISGKIKSLSNSKSIDVITTMKFDPRFEKYYPDVEDTLYAKDWGRTLGIISIKTKEIEKNQGMFASEQYLEDVANRISARLGEDSFVVQKVKNMKENLERLHAEGAKKLRYLRERLDKAKSSAEKILELQKISKNPEFSGVFGTIQNMERILIRDKFDEIYKKVKNLPIETQKALFDGVYNDLKELFKYDPELFHKINRYIKEINIRLENSKKQTPVFSDKHAEALEKFENGDLPLIDLSSMMELDYPSKEEYSHGSIEKKSSDYSHKLNTGELDGNDLEFVIDEINNDISLFKIDGCDDALSQIQSAGEYIEVLDKKVDKVKELDKLKESKNIKDFINGVFSEDGENFDEELNILNRGFSEKELEYDEIKKGYGLAAKIVKEKESKTKINDIVEVIRRIEKEIEPLQTIESKISKIGDWIFHDYKGKKHIIDFLNNQIRDLALAKGREGGLLRKLLDGLDSADNKIKYLKEKLNDFEYRYLRPTILTLIENLKSELDASEEDINEEWINKELESKNDDEKLGWLNVRKEWNKYDGHKEIIEDKINECKKKISGKKETSTPIYQDIVDLADACLELTGQAARQKIIKYQEDNDPITNPTFSTQRKLLFYLLSTDSEEPRKRILALTDRVTLKTSDKQKLLKLLKDIEIGGKGTLKEKLGLKDEDIAFGATYILFSDNPLEKRIKLLERFKTEADEKYTNYKEAFDIKDNTVYEVISLLRKKLFTSEQKEKVQEIPIEQETEGATLEKETEIDEIETTEEEHIAETPLEGKEDEAIAKTWLEENEEEIAEKVNKKKRDDIFDDFVQSSDTEDQLMDIEEPSDELVDIESEKVVMESFYEEEVRQDEEEGQMPDFVEESEFALEKDSIEIGKAEPEEFTEKEIESWEENKGEVKTTEEIIKEQELRKEYEKLSEKFEESQIEEFALELENRGKKVSKESVDKIREKAKEIKEDNEKRIEDKIKGLLFHLATCFPEEVPSIITNEILPVFRSEGLDLEVHNLLQTINNSVFKPALAGKNVDDNIKFLSKSLGDESVNSINNIVNKIKNIWIDILKSKETIENKGQKNASQESTITNEIKGTKRFGSILAYLNNISPLYILEEIEYKLLRSIKDNDINNKLQSFHKKLVEFYDDKDFTDDEKKLFYVRLKLDANEQKLFNDLINKIKQYKIDREKIEEEIQKEAVNPPKANAALPRHKEEEMPEIIDEKQNDEIKNKDILKQAAESEVKKVSEKNEELIDEEFVESEQISEEVTSSGPDKDVEELLIGMSSFVKPHAIILNFVRNHPELDENDYDVDARRDVVDRLFNNGKIFTFDGTTYVGFGQIDNIVKSNIIIGLDKPVFVRKLDAFLDKFDTQKQLFAFLGVKDEMEYRQLNFALDKYGGDRKVPRCLKSHEEETTDNKPTRGIRSKIREVGHTLVDSVKDEVEKAIPVKKPEKKTSVKNITFEKQKETIKKREEKKKETQMSLSELKKKNEEFINKNQRELLNEATKSINKGIERLIKTAQSSVDLEAINGSYFGSGETTNRNLLNLCYDIKKIAEIISKDKLLLSKLSFDRVKMKKLYDAKMKKFKK